MGILVVVPCGHLKVWRRDSNRGATKAEDVYISGYFKVNREYAEMFSDRWLILSAKYGLIPPDFMIPGDYNVSFNDPSTNPISRHVLAEQAGVYVGYDTVVALGGRRYTDLIEAAFTRRGVRIVKPVQGLGIGESMACLKQAIKRGVPY